MAKIRAVKIAAQGQITEYIEDLLKGAREGKIVGIAAATIEIDGNCSSGWALSRYGNHLALIGQIAVLKAELIEEKIHGDD